MLLPPLSHLADVFLSLEAHSRPDEVGTRLSMPSAAQETSEGVVSSTHGSDQFGYLASSIVFHCLLCNWPNKLSQSECGSFFLSSLLVLPSLVWSFSEFTSLWLLTTKLGVFMGSQTSSLIGALGDQVCLRGRPPKTHNMSAWME